MDGLDRHVAGPRLQRLEFSNVEALAAMLKPWGAEVTQLSKVSGKSRLLWAQLEALELRTVSITGRVHVDGALAAHTIRMQFDLGSSGLRRVGGQEVGADEILVGRGGSAVDFTSPTFNHGMNLTLPEPLIAAAMDARAPGADLLNWPTASYIMSNCQSAVWRIRNLVGAVLAQADLQSPAYAYGDIVDALVGTLMLPRESESPAMLRFPYYQRRPIVSRAEDFMRANLGEPLMLHDVCAAARASERTVEYAFRDTYGVGAKQYLKLLRLNRVRQELQTLPPEIASITQIATRYGFWHLGKFSVAYRSLFGETPRETRARRRAASAWRPGAMWMVAAD